MSKARQKGTSAETDLLRRFQAEGFKGRRTSAGKKHDVEVEGNEHGLVVKALATRPDRGQWLITLSFNDFVELLRGHGADIEVKRYARFAHHRIYEEKFGEDR